VAIIDDHTVEITPARPNLRLVQQLNHPVYSIVAPNSEPADTRIGTGPFRETEYVVDDHYTVEAYDGYWGEAPKVQRLTFRFYPDPTTRVLALQSGDVDLIVDVPKESAQDVAAGGDFQLLTSTVGAYNAIYVGIHGQPPYDLGQDKTVRQAVAHAIDKEAIVLGVWQGNAEVGRTMIPPAILGPAGDQITGVAYDPEQAKALLEQAGWTGEGTRQKDGRELKLTYVVGFPDASVHIPVPEFVQAQLAEVGIAVEIVQTPDTATYEARLQAGEGDLWAEQGNQNDGNPCFLPDLLFYTPPPDSDPESAMYGNMFAPGPAFDAHIDTCRSAVSIEEVQEAAAMAVKILIDEEFVVIPIAGTYRIYGVSANVQGLEPHPSGLNQRWTDVTVPG
jgi:peptide/nickel transport system substrate-binding protein